MHKVALYQKYRPENFDQVSGQDHIIQVLKNAVLEGKASHAYLFSGPRGTGKTSVARILAKALNCQDRRGYNPCGKCKICQGIAENRIMDLIEIDAASNRGIDEIRDLREKVKFSPSEGAYKVFIIDEVHMLTKEAFNALLKTLEEPPEHAIFILATTEINKVPATIISRCQRHDFRRIRLAQIVGVLTDIKNKEGIEISDEALEMIGETSEGGLRDAESLLDQLSGLGIKKVEAKDVENILGLAPHKVVSSFTTDLLGGKIDQALKTLEKASMDGVDLITLTKSASDLVRKILLAKLSGTEYIEGTKEQIEEIKTLADNSEEAKILALTDALIWAQGVFRTNVDPKSILTLMAAKIVNGLPPTAAKPQATAATTSKPKTGEGSNLNGKWQHFLLELKNKNNTIHAFLRVASPELTDDNTLILTFPYKFHKERLEEAKNKKFVEDILAKVYGETITIKCQLNGNHTNSKVSDVNQAASILGGEVVD